MAVSVDAIVDIVGYYPSVSSGGTAPGGSKSMVISGGLGFVPAAGGYAYGLGPNGLSPTRPI